MQLNDLPYGILTAILEQSMYSGKNGWSLGLNLQLLAVCPLLRRIALPLIYKQAYVSVYEYPTWRDEIDTDLSPGEPRHDMPDDQGARGEWRGRSNVGLIASVGHTGLVRRMAIDVQSGDGHSVGLRHAIRYLRNIARKWPSIHQLDITLSDHDYDPTVPFDDPGEVDRFVQCALVLRCMMPGVKGLCVTDTTRYPSSIFGELLVQSYHLQLRMLCFNAYASKPLSVDPAPAAQDGHNIKLDFPLLCHAQISCSSGPCLLLSRAVFPSSMVSLDIQVSAPVWETIAHTELPVAKQLNLAISSPFDDTALPLSLKRLLTNSHRCGEVALHSDHDPAAYLPQIAFTGLTMLTIEVPVGADVFLDVIGKLPRLVSLIALSSTRDTISANVDIPEPGELHLVEPLVTGLQKVSYGQQDDHEPSDADIVLSKYLLLKIPTLQWFGARHELAEKLEPIVAAYRQWYPHLAGVEFYPENQRRFFLCHAE